MFLNLINDWYFMIDGKVIWDILKLTNKFWKVTTKLFESNWINKTCWIEIFSEMIKDFLRGTFPRSWFQCWLFFVPRGKCLSSSLFDRRLIDLSIFYFKIFIFKKKLARSLILSRVFDNSFELAFWAICWSFKSYSSLNMTWSSHDWYNHVFSRIGNVSSVAEFI